ncbi:MAG: S-methyl-5-thioribose-1-phosphate isomerase [Lachnospiraceae bacterium]|nr:S-methyl-5-thioribose-1-phosphate isomerase [Lachnospiraceae bacterium]MBQ1515750.1 S-methyl-5-thioribose-1-phosphate isomerase [Lachnospiraceae bacterium]MBQ3401556.1 S-methyl-5-thioribose-1-phosphate isomerase [Lachnospiraceae bacterium]MBQ4309344.1 S-methyl-5-thioribose-1-phosphate isomerase [Lachnospiraceae bacterium]MBQ9464838.1 S-methyl-5-thioribose-1-phosphate isomerase [Lachnospiraceae bacterium]
MNALSLDTVLLAENEKEMIILDQTLLPGEIKYLNLSKAEDIWEAIYSLRVRGAPAIGVAAGYGIYLLADQIETDDMDEFVAKFQEQKAYLDSARPTAVNLSWALNRMEKVLLAEKDGKTVAEMKQRLKEEAHAIREEDIAISRNIGQYGFELLRHGDGILTHCNAGTLATAKYGTALAPIYIALENGWDDLHVFCDETRPLLQGARLSAFEMQTAGVDTTLICDNMASITMKRGKIDIVFVGCDRVAANGDFANKIGTSGVAILAKHYGIPFYCCAPSSTIDMSIKSGDEIVIEERKPEEVTEMWYEKRMAPEGVKVNNPAFDVTDHTLVTGIITEKGIAYPPFDQAFIRMGIGK